MNKIHHDVPEDVWRGRYSDAYFNRMKDVLKGENRNPTVLYQVFQRQDAVLVGIDEAVQVIRKACDDPDKVKVMALKEGDAVKPFEAVMTIEAPVQCVCRLETVLLGVMKRPTAIASNMRRVVDAANGKPVIFMGARFDHYKLQAMDGNAALVGGASAVSTEFNGLWHEKRGVGTIPHALIAAFGGDTVAAALAFDKHTPAHVDRIVLVDFDNDCVNTSIGVVEAFARQAGAHATAEGRKFHRDDPNDYIGKGAGKIYGVRFDTSGNMRDETVTPVSGKDSLGVCPELVCLARTSFDMLGWKDLKIVVSGGFTEERIREFELLRVPVDVYGVGSSIYNNMNRYDFTADIVTVDGKPCSKVGRELWPNPRLREVKL